MSGDNEPRRQLDLANTTVTVGLTLPEDGRDVEVDLRFRELFAAYLTIQAVGYNNAVGLINFAIGTSQELTKVNAGPRSFEAVLRLLEDRTSPVNVERKQFEKHVLSFCYVLRAKAGVSLTRTAEIATALLEEKIEPEALRKRIERWVDREKKPPAGQPRRKRKAR